MNNLSLLPTFGQCGNHLEQAEGMQESEGTWWLSSGAQNSTGTSQIMGAWMRRHGWVGLDNQTALTVRADTRRMLRAKWLEPFLLNTLYSSSHLILPQNRRSLFLLSCPLYRSANKELERQNIMTCPESYQWQEWGHSDSRSRLLGDGCLPAN